MLLRKFSRVLLFIFLTVNFTVTFVGAGEKRGDSCYPLLVAIYSALAGDFKKYGELQKEGFFAPGQTGYQFESDILTLYDLAPEFRDLKNFGQRWQLTDRQVQDLLIFYSWNVLEEPLDVAGKPEEVLERVRVLTRAHMLSESNYPWRFRYGYYRINAGSLAVPEMAKQLRISESQVYQELSLLRVSLVQAVNQKLRESISATEIGQLGISEALRRAGIGDQAWAFFEHHQGVENRGVRWSRLVQTSDGRFWDEQDLLRNLYEQGYEIKEIASLLNKAAHVSSPSDSNWRTEGSVTSKLRSLGLSEPAQRGPSRVYIPGYGVLKESGKLLPEFQKYLLNHTGTSIPDLAVQMMVAESTIKDFLMRYSIPAYLFGGTERQASARNEKYTRQRKSIAQIVPTFFQPKIANRRWPNSRRGQSVATVLARGISKYSYRMGKAASQRAVHSF